MKTIIAAAALSVAQAKFHDRIFYFTKWMAQHGRDYQTVEEFNFRFHEWIQKDKFIKEHNEEQQSYTVGHNQFSDWTHGEYKAILQRKETEKNPEFVFKARPSTTYEPISWVDQGCVNDIQDQGQCGSCWAFASVDSMEGRHCVATGELLKFSEQQLVDCSALNSGCNGGLEAYAYRYYMSHDAMYETAYPYTGEDGRCNYEAGTTNVYSTGNYAVSSNDADSMKAALEGGSLSVAIEADQLAFQMYTSGIFDNSNCGDYLDHAVGLVGWGQDGDQEYWLVRNSWGTTWGEKGYIRMAIVSGDSEGICGVQNDPNYPTGVN